MRDQAALPLSVTPQERLPEEHIFERLRALLDRGRRRAQEQGGPVVASLVLPFVPSTPEALASLIDQVEGDAFFWRPPAGGPHPGDTPPVGLDLPSGITALLGVGAARAVVAAGPGRFAAAQEAANELCRTALVERAGGPSPQATGPILVGGFAFDPEGARDPVWDGFPAGLLVVPELLVTLAGQSAWLTLNVLVGTGADPDAQAERLCERARRLEEAACRAAAPFAAGELGKPPLSGPHAGRAGEAGPSGTAALRLSVDEGDTGRWKEIVAIAASAVRSGKLEKAVLARRARVRLAQSPAPGKTLAALMASYPECYAFAVHRGGRTFLGATPERLVALFGDEVHAMCLAGSIRRGASAEEDERLGSKLLSDPKNLAEHRVVVDVIRSALAETCERLEAAGSPTLLKMRNVQHLHTPVKGTLKSPCSVLHLVARLHPTPAVGGHPKERALELIREIEGMDRGWYAGPIGWMDPAGEGEFAVALRSALLAGNEAVLFAGCGILGDSDPQAELEESALKMRPVIQALERSL